MFRGIIKTSDKNNLSNLVTEIGLMETLLTLSVGYNRIQEIPSEIGKLTNLNYIDFSELSNDQLS